MAVIINASTSTGLVQSADTSGIIEFQSNGSTKATLGPSGFSYPGALLQVVQVAKTNTFSTNSQSFVDITGLSASITPTSASNKILVCANISGSGDQHSDIRLVRGSTAIAIGDASGSQIQSTFHFYMGLSSSGQGYNIYSLAMMWLDSPATTSSITYKAQASNNWTSAYTTIINRTFQDQDAGYNARTPSTITLMEIAA